MSTNVRVKLTDVRLSYPSLFQKGEYEGSETKYGATFLIEPGAQVSLIKEIQEAMVTAGESLWGEGKIPKKVTICLHDGDDKVDPETGEIKDGYEGMQYLSARTDVRPQVVDRSRNPVTEEDGVFYAGCHVIAYIDIWAQKEYGGKINASLRGVQFYRDDAPFGAAPMSVDDFDEIGEEAVGNMFSDLTDENGGPVEPPKQIKKGALSSFLN